MQFNKKQRAAIESAISWYFSRTFEQQHFTICGLAGTGKSTVVSSIVQVLGLTRYQSIYVAFTGKAVSVLRMKGLQAHTIHRTFYQIYKSGGGVTFKLKTALPSIIKLIVVDEASMVNDKMMDDILSFGIPVILLGDPGQLPPIFGGNRFLNNPDVFLDEVMRTNDSSGILELADRARQMIDIPFGKYGASRCISMNDIGDMTKYDIILCWKNETRMLLNKNIRSLKKLTHIYPIQGEKIICLKNNYEHEATIDDIDLFLVNGLNGIVIREAYDMDDDNNTFTLRFVPDFAKSHIKYFDVPCNRGIFDSYLNGRMPDLEDIKDESIAILDYGYALTVHKSQGSEWDNVLIIDEYGGSKDIYPKWLYTGITRGKKSVTLARV